MAEIMINVIQNISQNRVDRRITQRDLNYARYIAGQTYFPGLSQYAVNEGYQMGICPVFFIYCVKGTDHNKCKVIWSMDGHSTTESPDDIKLGSFSGTSSWSLVNSPNGELNSPDVYKSLEIEKGEVKILLEFHINALPSYKFWDGTSLFSIPLPKRFGLFLISPKSCRNSRNIYSYFNSVVIFNPKPGLFSETPPR